MDYSGGGLLNDSESLFLGSRSESNDHRVHCHNFCENNHIDDYGCSSHIDYAKLFNKLGIAVVFNSGNKVDGYYFCSISLPEQCTMSQINFFENAQPIFKEKYYKNVSFFGTLVYSSKELEYRSKDKNLRSLKIESIINGQNCEDGQELLYQELNKQKTFLTESNINR